MIKKLIKDTKGGVSMIAAVAIVPMTIIIGGSVDYSVYLKERQNVKAALDAGVLSAGRATGESADRRKELGDKSFTINLTENCSALPTFIFNGDVTTASISCESKSLFLGLIGTSSFPILVDAAARVNPGDPPCVLTLAESGKESVNLNSDSYINAPSCEVRVNSTDGEAVSANSDSGIIASNICLTGGFVTNSNSDLTPQPENCPPINDPLANIPAPASASLACEDTKEDFEIKKSGTVEPGVYCGGMKLDGNIEVTFEPGEYIIRNGEFHLNSGASAVGDDVLIYLTGNNNPRLNINSDSHIEFSGRLTGPQQGLVFFQDRNATSDTLILNSDSSSIIEGVIYLPNTGLELNSDGALSPTAPWTVVLVDTLDINSESTLNVNSDYDSSNVPLPVGYASAFGGDILLVR